MDLPDFLGPNAGYLLELYDRYQHDPESVPPDAREFFAHWTPPAAAVPSGTTAPANVTAALAAAALANAIRAHGHVAARLDPLGGDPPGDPALELGTHGLTEADLAALPGSVAGVPWAATALSAVEWLREIYAGTSGYDFAHLRAPAERAWLREAVESCRYCALPAPEDPAAGAADAARALLRELTRVDVFERFLHRTFPGQTRFSIEGVDALVPMLNTVIGAAAEAGTRAVLLGMAHRGRLNVMAHVLGKPYDEILLEFHDPARRPLRSHSEGYLEGYMGDVKYHLGVSRAVGDGPAVDLLVQLAPNPSHLEYVNPVVEGMARAAGERDSLVRPGAPEFDADLSLPILVHGDAAVPGQGVVAETLNLLNLPGYRTGGTVHIIANNQLGFTTNPSEGRSTLYASDLAKGFKIPIVHVNADDALACIAAARLAHAYRDHFHKDFMLDLIGYRRWGHNEGDEPSFTQPVMYERISRHPAARQVFAQSLLEQGTVTQADIDRMEREVFDELQAALERVRAAKPPAPSRVDGGDGAVRVELPPLQTQAPNPDATQVSAEQLRALNEVLVSAPEGMTLNPKLQRAIDRRRQALTPGAGPKIDWAHAESLAFAVLLTEGVPIRLTGQDTERGTFTQRHLVFHDYKTGATYTPLQHLPGARAAFAVYNSSLSENAVLGFEYGYNVQVPGALVLWEAQYGDFVNGAQVVVDQFVASARAKWHQQPSLGLLLPHGYEGQGPEHSSARLERFLQLAADDNLRVAYCTTAAQYFHLLRRHAGLLRSDPRPLIVMTPKRLLRHALASSDLEALTECCFQPVIAGESPDPAAVRRLVLCSGKVYVDLADSPEHERPDVAVARVEELYPFPDDAIAGLLERHPGLAEVVWLQEEPQNMGAWSFVRPRLETLLGGLPLRYIGRPERASPAEGSADVHAREQARIAAEAFGDVPGRARRRAPREVKHAR